MLVCIDGQMGSGKTLLMSVMAQYVKEQGIQVFANYSLKGAEKLKSIGDIKEAMNGLVCLDEFWIMADSRMWKMNIDWTRWVLMSRKKSLLILYTTQHFNQVDVRIRNATDYIIFCEDIKKNQMFRYSIITGAVKSIIRSFKLSYSNASKFYEVYNTNEIIKPLIANKSQ